VSLFFAAALFLDLDWCMKFDGKAKAPKLSSAQCSGTVIIIIDNLI